MTFDLDSALRLAPLVAVAVAWGDLRRSVRGLADEVRRQNGRIGKVEGLAAENTAAVEHVRGFLNL